MGTVALTPTSSAALASGTAAILVLVIAIGISGGEPRFDTTAMAWANSWRHPSMDSLFRTMTWFGSLAILAPLSGALAWRLAPHRGLLDASFTPVALLTTAAATHAIKLGLDRARPDAYAPLIAMPPDASFPSAHSAQVAAFAIALALQVRAAGHRRIVLVGSLALLAAIVVASRIYLQVHFPTDTLAGIALAVCVVFGLRACPLWRSRSP